MDCKALINDRLDYTEAEDLWLRAEDQNVFNHPGFWRALEETDTLRGKLSSIEVRTANGLLIGLWPFIHRIGAKRDLFFKTLEPLGARHADYIVPLIAKGEAKSVIPKFGSLIDQLFKHAGKLYLPKLIEGSAYTTLCLNVSNKGIATQKFQSPSQRLRFGETYSDTEKGLGWRKKHRPSARLRRLQREGDLELWIAKDRVAIKECLQTLFNLHVEKWHRDGYYSQFNKEQNKEIFYRWVDYLPMKCLHYSELRLDGKAISVHFGFLSEGWLYWYKPAYNIEFEKLSPGVAHIAMITQLGIENSWTGIDFLQGDESYKFRWSNDVQETIYLRSVKARGLPWLWWETHVRSWVRGYAAKPIRQLKRRMRQ